MRSAILGAAVIINNGAVVDVAGQEGNVRVGHLLSARGRTFVSIVHMTWPRPRQVRERNEALGPAFDRLVAK
jgi:hypothetical protein